MAHDYQIIQRGNIYTRTIWCTKCGRVAFDGNAPPDKADEYQAKCTEPCVDDVPTEGEECSGHLVGAPCVYPPMHIPKCPEKPCKLPTHLWLASQADNCPSDDAMEKAHGLQFDAPTEGGTYGPKGKEETP